MHEFSARIGGGDGGGPRMLWLLFDTPTLCRPYEYGCECECNAR